MEQMAATLTTYEASALEPVEPQVVEEHGAVDSLKAVTDLVVVAETVGGERRAFDRQVFVDALHTGILGGTFHAGSAVEVHAKAADGGWKTSTLTLGEFAKHQFPLLTLYEPLWSHALVGLKWGALVGVGLKLLDTGILLWSANETLGLLFLLAVGACLIPRVGVAAVVALSVAMSRFTRVNMFIVGLAAAATGAALGCLPGMAVGGMAGLLRRRTLQRAPDAPPEPGSAIVKAVVLPALTAAAVWAFYLFVFNPWIVSNVDG